MSKLNVYVGWDEREQDNALNQAPQFENEQIKVKKIL